MKFTASELKDKVSNVLQNCHTSYASKEDCENVRLLLMTVNDNEFFAVLYYMANKHKGEDVNIPKSLTVKGGTRFFIGEFAHIPTALVQHDQGSARSQFVAGKAMDLFDNLNAIVAVGVCGTLGDLGDVIISEKISGFINIKYDTDGKILRRDSERNGSQQLIAYLKAQNWKFDCTKETGSDDNQYLSKLVCKTFLSSSTLVAYQDFRDKIREDICREAMGIEMEGIGIINAIEFNEKGHIHFVIVKAGCDYANEGKSKEWQPVAAMAAADLVYFQFDKPDFLEWFTGTYVCIHIQTKLIQMYFVSKFIAYICTCPQALCALRPVHIHAYIRQIPRDCYNLYLATLGHN